MLPPTSEELGKALSPIARGIAPKSKRPGHSTWPSRETSSTYIAFRRGGEGSEGNVWIRGRVSVRVSKSFKSLSPSQIASSVAFDFARTVNRYLRAIGRSDGGTSLQPRLTDSCTASGDVAFSTKLSIGR